MRYAQNTAVSSDRSRAEIETILMRYGAEHFAYATRPGRAIIGFRANNRTLRFELPLPMQSGDEFRLTAGRGKVRTLTEQHRLWEQACRQRWRALVLVIKAKLEAVECGISEFDSEFLAHIVMGNGQTMGEWAIPQLAKLDKGRALPMLPLE